MLVSVIMPMYNAETYIKPCLESILNQTYKEIEIIIVDDGSTDDSAEIVKKYAENDSRIKYYYQENQSACVALNNGLKYAQGEYITFADNDDLIEIGTFQSVINSLKDIRKDIVVYGYSQDFVDEGYSTKCVCDNFTAMKFDEVQETLIHVFENGLFHPFWNKWYRREMVLDSGVVFDKRYNSMGDYSFNCRLFQHIKSMETLNFIGYHYLKRNRDSLVASFVKDMVPCFIERRRVTKELFDFFELGQIESARKYYNLQYYYESEDFLINLYKKKSDLSKVECEKFIDKYILDDDSILHYQQLEVDTLYSKIFKFSVNTKNAGFIGLIYKLLTKLKNNFFGIYKYFRKMQYKKYK